jgi:hypothetical protein
VFYEGRGPAVAGAHTRDHNRSSHAVCVLGNYEVTKPPQYVIDDLGDWARWHGTVYGPPRYRPHNAVGSTLCPGKYLSAMIPDINLYAEAVRPAPSSPDPITRGWIEERIIPTFPDFDAWAAEVEQYGD